MDAMPSLAAPTKERTPSLRSVGSNSSIASGVSLTRRPRTRARSRTVTGGQPDTASLRNAATMESGILGKPVVAEPESVHYPRSTDPSPSRPRTQRPATADAHFPDSKSPARREFGPATATLGVSTYLSPHYFERSCRITGHNTESASEPASIILHSPQAARQCSRLYILPNLQLYAAIRHIFLAVSSLNIYRVWNGISSISSLYCRPRW